MAGRNLLYTCSILRASSHAGRPCVHGQTQHNDVKEQRVRRHSTRSRLRSKVQGFPLSSRYSKGRSDYWARYEEYREVSRQTDERRQRFNKFAALVELIPTVLETEVAYRSVLQVNTMGNNDVRDFVVDNPSGHYAFVNERLLAMLIHHERFIGLLRGALIDAPVHVRLREHILGFETTGKSVHASTNNLSTLSNLRRTLYMDTDALAVAIFDYRCRSKWGGIIKRLS